ncbi:MAG: PBP1A family penicillin-binding protein [Lachnospiraceae bacterium]|nr:PBP1A family penicillin-binding protein [Lachnospiraceae bacterium]
MTKKKKKKFWLLTRVFQSFFIVVFMACMIVAVGIYMKYGKTVLTLYSTAQKIVEESSEKDFKATETSLVYDGSGDLMKTLKGEKDLYYLDFSSIPEDVKNALICIEDKKFYQHNGIDVKRIAGSLLVNLKAGGISQGGSTITQQLARSVYLNNDVTYTRKIKEVFISIGLEKKYGKDQILEYYINNIYFGNGYYGIQAAANGYFRKSVSSLSLSQIAFLCAIPNGPSMYDPYQHKEDTLKRRDLILKEMKEDGAITEEQYEEAINEKIKVKKPKKTKISSVDSFVMDSATKALMKKQGFEFRYSFDSDEDKKRYDKEYNTAYDQCEATLYTGGYRIYTSIDQEKQKMLQAAVDDTLTNYTDVDEETKMYKLQASATCIDNSSGRVVAIVGGRSQDDVEGYSLNRAFQSYRQPGSSIKPLIVYAPALERGYTPDSIVSDTKLDEKDAPKNSDGVYMGRITLRKAVEKSRNVVAWRLFKELTPQVGLSYLKSMHYSNIVSSDYVLAASVGGLTYGTNTKEMASGYATLANNGVYREPTCIVSITDSDGEIIVSDEVEETQIYEENADLMMVDVMKGVLKYGTGAGLALSGNMPCAGKTGTTDDNKDGWFCGFSKYYTTSVWVGYDTPQRLTGLFGGTYPGKIWKIYMEQIHQGLAPQDWEKYTVNGKKKDSTEENDGTTEEKTTEKVTEEVTTEADTETPVATEAPLVTEAPVTEAPVTEAPATQEPVTEAPATQAPVTETTVQ